MESSVLQLKSLSDSWMSLSSIFIAMDVIFGIMCGVGLFFLLIPFLKTYPVSPPPGSGKNTPKVMRRRPSKTRKKNASGKGCSDDRKSVEENQNPSQPVEIPIKQLLLDSASLPFGKSNEKQDQLPLSQLLSHLKFLEDVIQQKFSQIFWGMSSVLSESVVATAWVSKRPYSARHKTVRFSDTVDPFPALPLAQGPPHISQAQPLPHQLVTPSLADLTEVQTLYNLPSSTPNQVLSSSTSRASEKPYPTIKSRIKASLLTENQPWQQDLEWKDTIGSNVQNHQAAISQPTHKLPRDLPPAEAIGSASIPPEHCQFLQHHEEPHSEYRMTKVREQGPPFRFLPSQELTQLQGHFPANSRRQSKDKPELPQPAQPSILDYKSCKSSQMIETTPSGMPLKKGPARCNIHELIKEGPSFRAKVLPCTSSSTPGQGLKPRKCALRTEQLSYVNTTQDLSFLDPETQRKLDSNIKQLPTKHRWRPYSVSKVEYYSKAAMILEKLHHRDPGGTRVETVSASRLQSPLFAHSPSEVQEMQRTTPPAASHGPAKAHPDTRQSYLSTQTRAFCFQAKTQKSRIVQGTGRGSLQPRASPRMPKHAAWKRFEDVASGHPCWSGTMPDPQERVPPPVVKQTNRSEEKKETTPAWKVSLGFTEIPIGQAINIHLRDFEFKEASRSPGRLQTPTPQHSGDSALKTQVCSEIDFRSNKQPQARPVGHHKNSLSSVSLPSEHLLPSFQNRSKKPKTFQDLDDIFMRRDPSQETQNFRVPKNKIQAKNHKAFHPNDKKKELVRSRATCQEESSGRGRPSTPSFTQFKDTSSITEFQPSFDMPEKGQALPENNLKKMKRIFLQYLDLNTKDKGQGDSLKSENSTPATVITQEADSKEKLLYSMVVEMQYIMNVVVQILVNWLGLNVGDPIEEQWYKVEPLTSHLSHSPKGLYDPKNSRPERLMCPEGQSHPSIYKGIRDKQQLVVGAQRACDQHQNRVKSGMGYGQLPTPKGNNHPCRNRGIGDKQQLDVDAQRAYDPNQIKMKSGRGCYPHASPKGHKHLFMHRNVRDKQQSGIVQRACDPHQRTEKGMGCGHLIGPRENNHPVTYRGSGDKKQSYAAAQRAGHPKWTLPA
ncbi:spermatogenesis-associated protein 31-like [Peromyscus californicus insignis]|uniref:spermatogenesis-associated protein 31-like n=1 Tax=Peromyscus californicus insignis TaxID=564181 RepID=UPI0022A7475F|nr:spermatogenesis-associated protein 31-like [Peromyscus californicus insignis]